MEASDSDSKKPNTTPAPFSGSVPRLAGLVEGILVFTPLITAVGIFGYQAYQWARQGNWISLSFGKFLQYLGLPPVSFFTPENWVGLTKVVQTVYHLPAALIFFFFSIALAIVLSFFHSR